MVIKESYEGEYENRQHACEAGMESWKEGRRKVLLHLRQCQTENDIMRKALLEIAYGDAYEIITDTAEDIAIKALEEVGDE